MQHGSRCWDPAWSHWLNPAHSLGLEQLVSSLLDIREMGVASGERELWGRGSWREALGVAKLWGKAQAKVSVLKIKPNPGKVG